MSNVRINSTFSLRKINPKLLHEKYMQGITTGIFLTDDDKLNDIEELRLDYTIGKTPNDEIYEYSDSNTNTQRIITVNNNDFIRISKLHGTSYGRNNDNIHTHKEDNLCNECNDFIDDMTKYLGIPLKMDVETTDDDKVITFYVDNHYCSFECMWPTIFKHTSGPYSYRNINYLNAEQYTRIMFRLMYPDADFITICSDTTLLKHNNGPMEIYDFKSSKHSYVEIAGLVISPAKRTFIQMTKIT